MIRVLQIRMVTAVEDTMQYLISSNYILRTFIRKNEQIENHFFYDRKVQDGFNSLEESVEYLEFNADDTGEWMIAGEKQNAEEMTNSYTDDEGVTHTYYHINSQLPDPLASSEKQRVMYKNYYRTNDLIAKYINTCDEAKLVFIDCRQDETPHNKKIQWLYRKTFHVSPERESVFTLIDDVFETEVDANFFHPFIAKVEKLRKS